MFHQHNSHSDFSFTLLLQALHGVTLWRPNVVYGGCILAGAILWEGLASWGQDAAGAVLGAALFVLAVLIGYLAAGRLLVYDARGERSPGIWRSIAFALRAWPRLLLLVVMEGLLLLGIGVVEMLAFGLTRIPAFGPYLVVPLFPLAVIFNAALLILAIIVFNLSGPALWHGEGVAKALRHTITIARKRPGSVLLMMLLLGVLSSAVAVVIILLLYGGYALTLAAATPFLANALYDHGGGEALLLDWLPNLHVAVQQWQQSVAPIVHWTHSGQRLSWFAAGILTFLLPNVVFLLGMAHLYLEALELEAPEDL
ncbi:hypothetical protein HFU84_07390 [Acidithiobacillus sp. CV18-2]|uniref:Uncharacterized protein n=1 Tax=Igneacidithiobacillus copahuensis TaxID=2724909 RepID=A0AAE3CIX9_9PROT|nr:hypothetical protein [Igneacidithiobacillus copahuensis]MBU2755351.1 hypothetical protein [Acidithiobacillus sp. CV18-3]MBU2757729.1 hypothetical protein [Acidithiobacillus sp. BN09-2]MBU2777329.1 hypothetical protein [Acidithiobacillus sp. CV18-2]MBU2797789.1 hypothetical protein [Acidithiobacillus sp. VAN18-2]MBU2798550.1 hypothetical protein [Acidithiobacillus sp. VAN18-4]UTV80575.1 hypothetical protein MQE22_11230 [Acidithiobacillus sp. YTS05]